MAQAWTERVNKENMMAEKFWHEWGGKTGSVAAPESVAGSVARSAAPTGSVAPSGRTATTQVLRSKLEFLESALKEEKIYRQKVEADLESLKNTQSA
eukprot:CAMPEP_0183792510 /NCGR_PEP_ID=MMETSP0803_2-20130417/2621_1 /TAXON_ID=195967 /ORGANISM="Crustomastix stigmata, Strain CCMP3273" /LENGTH=96 /DNA_ID=CAMNT_0026036867 /DNA_START=3 /DNA_END=293 /DNA_ORIENTATION=-